MRQVLCRCVKGWLGQKVGDLEHTFVWILGLLIWPFQRYDWPLCFYFIANYKNCISKLQNIKKINPPKVRNVDRILLAF